LEPLTAPGCDNDPIEGLLPNSLLWSKTIRENFSSYGFYLMIILIY